MIREVLKFFDNIITKKPETTIEEYTPIYVPNKYETCLKNDIAEIYVSANGDDNNSGFSESEPLLTLDKGFKIMKDYGFSSVHFYLMTATNFYMTDYKNVAGCSIHFHTRADGVNLHIVNHATAEKPEYDYTAFYGNHYNFGNTRKLTPGDDYNITQKMNVIFHSNERASYFEGCSVIFNACRIFQNNMSSASLNASTASEHYLYPVNKTKNYTGFAGCSAVQFEQCIFYDELTFTESNVYFYDCDFFLRTDEEAFIYGRNSKFVFRMRHTGNTPNYLPVWTTAHAYAFRFNNNIINTNNYVSVDNLIYGMGCDFNFYDGIGLFIAGASNGSTNYINRVITLRNSTLTMNSGVVTGGDNGLSAIDQLNHYNPSGSYAYPVRNDNTCTCSTVNGVYKNSFTGDLG
ncbi:MAG: hypothetical protein IKG27_05730 [Bacilli bacterium]|nr:hypothetical protein [Bacilli bacterium]